MRHMHGIWLEGQMKYRQICKGFPVFWLAVFSKALFKGWYSLDFILIQFSWTFQQESVQTAFLLQAFAVQQVLGTQDFLNRRMTHST